VGFGGFGMCVPGTGKGVINKGNGFFPAMLYLFVSSSAMDRSPVFVWLRLAGGNYRLASASAPGMLGHKGKPTRPS
jgi:hypothetical protein